MNQVQYRIAMASSRSPFVGGAVMGILTGPPFGLFMGLTHHSLGEGVFEGIFFAVFFGFTMGIILRRKARQAYTRGETPAQRVQVARALAKGDAVQDPALASAVISVADDVIRQTSGRTGAFGRWFSPVGLCVSLAFLIGAIVRNDGTVIAVWAVLAGVYLMNLWLVPKGQKKSVANARRARQYAEAGAADPSGVAPPKA